MNYLQLKWYKLTHWEFWPMKFIYYPLFIVWLYFAIKARSFFFFNAANPSIKNGGMAMESKMGIYNIIPAKHIPTTLRFENNIAVNNLMDTLNNAGIHYPFIVKPDIGMKAFGVEKIKNQEELITYLKKIQGVFLVQQFIEYPNEIGVFYVRHPSEKIGKITGIVSKEFLGVIGDNKKSILQLIKENPRSHLQISKLKKKYGEELNTILGMGEKYILVPFGSHTRGAKFIDDTGKRNEGLLSVIDQICSQIPEFYYGRLDILCNSIEELSQGLNFKIIEINGAGSEPTHIYDPKHSLFFGWQEIIQHWNMLYQVSEVNHKKGYKYLSYKDGMNMLRANSRLEAHLKNIQ